MLGARVKEHTVSNSLKKRLDRAIVYAEENPYTILVLSGGKGPGEADSEAQVMYDYLVYNGVSPRQLLMESDSTSTVENIAYSKIVIEQDRMKDKKEIRCGHCNKLLGKGTAHDLEIKCPRCGTLNHLRDRIPGSEPSDGQDGAFYAGSEEKISH